MKRGDSSGVRLKRISPHFEKITKNIDVPCSQVAAEDCFALLIWLMEETGVFDDDLLVRSEQPKVHIPRIDVVEDGVAIIICAKASALQSTSSRKVALILVDPALKRILAGRVLPLLEAVRSNVQPLRPRRSSCKDGS